MSDKPADSSKKQDKKSTTEILADHDRRYKEALDELKKNMKHMSEAELEIAARQLRESLQKK